MPCRAEDEVCFVVEVSAYEDFPFVFVEPYPSAVIAAVQTKIYAMTDRAVTHKTSALRAKLAGGGIGGLEIGFALKRLFGKGIAMSVEPLPILKRLDPPALTLRTRFSGQILNKIFVDERDVFA